MTPPNFSKWKAELRKQVRPFFFLPPVQRFVSKGNRVASRFLFEKKAKERLKLLFSRLPYEFSVPAQANLDRYFEACLEGRGLGPASYLELSRWLGGGDENILVPPKANPEPAAAPRKKPPRLKILFVTGAYPSIFHGGGLRVRDLLGLLSEKHDVSLYCMHDEAHDGPADISHWKGLEAVKVVKDDRAFFADFLPWIKLRGQEPFDAIHFCWQQSAQLMREARPFGRRLIFEYVESLTRYASLDLKREIEDGAVATAKVIHHLLSSYRAEGLGTALADETISVIPQDAHFAAHVFGGGEGEIIPTCLSESEFGSHAFKAAPKNQEALFLGFFGHPPNGDSLRWYLSEVHPRVCRRLPHYRLRVAGRGAESTVRTMLEGVPQVFYRGQFDDLVDEIAAARIGVAPLISGAGIRGKVNQYSAVGRPTVSTTIGVAGLPYVANESIMVADSPGEFAQRVIRLLEDETLYETMRVKAHDVAEKNFRWKAYLNKLEMIYEG